MKSTKKLNILHVITTIEIGGAEKQLLILVRQQISEGHQVAIVFLKGEPELLVELQKTGATVFAQVANKSVLNQIVQLRTLIRRDFNLIHTHLPRAEVLTFFTFSNVAWVTSRHNAEPFLPNGNKLLSRALSRTIVMRIDCVVAISDAVRHFLLKSKEIKSCNKLEVIRYGFDDNKTIGYQNRFSRKTNSSVVKIVCISRLVPQKDLKTLLKAISELQTGSHSYKAEIYGEGELKEELQEFSASLGVSDNVKFLGKTSNINEVLSNADIFVLTSKYEGFGLVLLEAMQANLPIVCCRNAATEEVLGIDYPGLVDVGDYIGISAKIVDFANANNKEILLKYLRERLTEFSPEKMWKNLRSLYFKVLSIS